MPRVSINKKKYLKTDLREWIIGRMKSLNLTQEDMSQMMNITQQAFGYRLREGNFKSDQLYVIFNRLQATDEEILRLMKL
ncbi:MAG: hypothetical protein HFI95_04725 [Lachnospiraceae bacterium]|nr:hypothetical protein [Lachnospiraceae bacterium]